MQSEKIEILSTQQQQAVFGYQDHIVRLIERSFNVSVTLRDSAAEIKDGSDADIKAAASVLRSLIRLYEQDEDADFSDDMVYRLIDEARQGTLAQTVAAMGDVVAVTHKGAPVKCKTTGQKEYVRALRENIVTICIGPAGTGKTYLAAALAVDELRRGEIERIIMSRPAIEAGEERLGFLPGDLEQKVNPYLRPLFDALYDMYGADRANKLRERGIIEIAPLAYMRGRTLNHARVIIDESQNLSFSTLKMALTRLGEGSRMVLTGDVTQIDLPHKQDSGLERCAGILKRIDGIEVVRLTNRDVVRNRIVKEIVKAFEKAEEGRRR